MTIGEAIKSVRQQKGITQKVIEQKTGIKKEYLSRIENNRLKNPTHATLCKIAKGINTELSALFKMTEG